MDFHSSACGLRVAPRRYKSEPQPRGFTSQLIDQHHRRDFVLGEDEIEVAVTLNIDRRHPPRCRGR
jgi:hypothetical protein